MPTAEEVHDALTRPHSHGIVMAASHLRGAVSTHTAANALTLRGLQTFQRVVERMQNADKSFVASVQGKLTLTVNTGYSKSASSTTPAPCSGRKRSRDSAQESVENAVRRLRSKDGSGGVAVVADAVASGIVERMLRVEGPLKERVVESWALTRRVPGLWASNTPDQEEKGLLLIMRLLAGVPLPLKSVCDALAECKDGMLTVDGSCATAGLELPMSEQSHAAEANGQKTMLLLVSIPGTNNARPQQPPKSTD